MMNFMLQMVLVKMTLNDLPHSLGIFEEGSYKIREFSPSEVDIPGMGLYSGYRDPNTIDEGLTSSMEEEILAESYYNSRANHAQLHDDPVTAEVYRHVAKEEGEHYREFGLRRQEIRRGQLSSTRAITH